LAACYNTTIVRKALFENGVIMKSQQFEKYAACFLVAVLSLVLGIEHAFASPASTESSASGLTAGSGTAEPTCGCG
jgi:hypothetical protein